MAVDSDSEPVVLITGGASGIGRATAQAFAARGSPVVIGDVDADGARETVRLIEASGGEGTFVRTDVSESADVEAFVDAAVAEYGRIDACFNNAAIEGPQELTAEYPEDGWNRVVDVTLGGVWRCLKYELRQFDEQGTGGAIVNAASILGEVAEPNFSGYVAAKHGVIGLTKTAALEYADADIRVNAVCPGYVETPMLRRSGALTDEERRARIEEAHPIGRFGQPEEIAAAVTWLCSPEASFVTGHAMAADGGYLSR